MIPVFAVFFAVSLLMLSGLYAVGTKKQQKWLVALGLIGGIPIAAGLYLLQQPIVPEPEASNSMPTASAESGTSERSLPSYNQGAGFVSADACKSCHAEQYESWHHTYHRTMTQAATPEAVIPSFNNVALKSRGREYLLKRKEDEFWVNTISPLAEIQAFAASGGAFDPTALPREDRQIIMTTGSHFHQTYWMQEPNGMLVQFPWVYHMTTKRWVYRIDSFLRPPTDNVTFNFWNMHCVGCHSTGGEPRLDPAARTMHSVGELGISCEACHGPGAAHVAEATSRSPSGQPLTDTLVHPGKLDAVASSQTCGQCHSASRIHDQESWNAHGNPYRPGKDNFDAVRTVYDRVEDEVVSDENFGTSVKTRFWPDGTVRTGGREYNGLIRSKCHVDGHGERQMSCVSCHSMHNYESPNKLMAKGKTGDAQCTQCHTEPEYNDQIALHTHHNASSSGSQCVNCHMPHTSYALFTAIRSHRIQSPSVRAGKRGARPNACNLCHLDETKSWAAEKLEEWYQLEAPQIDGDEANIAAGILWALKGDAAQRSVAAWHFGWQPALDAAGTDWMIPVMADLLTDKYAAVRYIAYEMLRLRSPFADLEYDFDGPEDHRTSVRKSVLQIWQTMTGDGTPDAATLLRVLLDDRNTRNTSEVTRLLQEQDQRPISIVE